MQIDTDKVLMQAIMDGMIQGIKDKFQQSYNNPLYALVNEAINNNRELITSILDDAINHCLHDAEFRLEIRDAASKTLAKTLVSRLGGDIEKTVNSLKSDPVTRARITLAIEEIVKSKT